MITFRLRIERPEEIDEDTLAEIRDAASAHDINIDSQIKRWLGSALSEAEDVVNARLPEGWHCKVEEAR